MPDTHAHRLTDATRLEPLGDAITGRRILMFNNDVEISICVPEAEADYFYRDGEGDEVVFVHEGGGVAGDDLRRRCRTRQHDYVVIPRGTTYRFRFDGPQRWLCFYTPGRDRDAEALPQPLRAAARARAVLAARLPGADGAEVPTTRRGEYLVKVRVRGGYQDYVLDYHPFDVVGWDGYVYPYTFNIADFEPKSGRLHQPPPAHQQFEGPNFVICSFCPRELEWDPEAVVVPYHHSNVQSEEVMYYVAGDYKARKGVEVGTFTLHPSGLPHGPQPGAAEATLGHRTTNELAVMCDTFRPLKLTTLARDVDEPSYAFSWNPDKQAVPAG